jgi:hypothetical protein
MQMMNFLLGAKYESIRLVEQREDLRSGALLVG